MHKSDMSERSSLFKLHLFKVNYYKNLCLVIRKRRNDIPVLQMRTLRLKEDNLLQWDFCFCPLLPAQPCLSHGEEAEQTSLRRLCQHKTLRHQRSHQHTPKLYRDEHQIHWIEGRERCGCWGATVSSFVNSASSQPLAGLISRASRPPLSCVWLPGFSPQL